MVLIAIVDEFPYCFPLQCQPARVKSQIRRTKEKWSIDLTIINALSDDSTVNTNKSKGISDTITAKIDVYFAGKSGENKTELV